MIVLSSIFRDSTDYLDRYFEQVNTLREKLDEPFKLIIAEGDSTDGTYEQLVHRCQDYRLPAVVLREDHGGPKFGSENHPQRWRQIAQVCNAVMRRVTEEKPDRFVYVESDLVWPVDTILVVLEDLDVYPAVAPMSMHGPSGLFWDTWGHMRNGRQFEHEPPYHPYLGDGRFVELNSAGSCFALRGELVPDVRFSPADCIRGVGRTIREAGGKLWLDRSVDVIHP